MTANPLFPNALLAWTFFATLIVLLSVAAVVDLRRVTVPKWLSLTILAFGVLFNLVRGAWLGSLDREVWQLGVNGVWIGAADGFVFALAGFLVGFAIFFFMWMIGACGGGDVKLFAAVSVWVGAWMAVWIFVLSALVVFVLLVLKLAMRLIFNVAQTDVASPADGRPTATRSPQSGRGLTYSLPLALATAAALLWFFRFELNLAQLRPVPGSSQLTTAAVVR